MNNLLLEGLLEAREVQEQDGRLKFKFWCMRDNTMSANKRFYGESFIDESIARTQAWIEAGNVVTVYANHGSALGGMTALPTKLPTGMIQNFVRDGHEMVGEASISPTSEGKDIQTLIRDGVMKHMSIRAYEYESEPMKMSLDGDEVQVEHMKWAIIAGVDFCDRPGIAGAGITHIFESAPELEPEERAMLTLEMLKEEHPDLVAALIAEQTEALSARVETLEASLSEAEAMLKESEGLPERIAELEAEIESRRAEIGIWERAATPLVRKIKERIEVENPEDIDALRAEVIHLTLAEVNASMGTDVAAPAEIEQEPDLGDDDYLTQGETLDIPDEIREEVNLLAKNLQHFARFAG